MPTFDNTPPLPGQFLESRLTEEMFRRYEPLIAKAVDAFPNETSFKVPPDVSPQTFLARFRDARLSYLRFGWKSEAINREKLIEIQGKHTLSLDSATGCVWFRQKQRRGRPIEFAVEATSHGTGNKPITWDTYTREDLVAVCHLINAKRLSGPIVLRGKLDTELEADLMSQYDVALSYDPDSSTTILL